MRGQHQPQERAAQNKLAARRQRVRHGSILFGLLVERHAARQQCARFQAFSQRVSRQHQLLGRVQVQHLHTLSGGGPGHVLSLRGQERPIPIRSYIICLFVVVVTHLITITTQINIVVLSN